MSNIAGDRLEFHVVAGIFPMLEGEAFEALKQDIKVNGQHDPIWTYQGKIIDGRNRERACRELGIEPGVRKWDGRGDLVAFVVSQNLHRRHLTGPQRCLVAARLKQALAECSRSGCRHRFWSRIVAAMPDALVCDLIAHELAHVYQWATGWNVVEEDSYLVEENADWWVERWRFSSDAIDEWTRAEGITRVVDLEGLGPRQRRRYWAASRRAGR